MQGQAGDPEAVVMKFGGSSVADLDRLRAVADHIVARARRQPVVVVVSAMGAHTDGLLAQARTLCAQPPARELDMLLTTGERQSMALLALAVCEGGARAISLTGSQVGLITDHRHGRARVVEVRPFRILDELAAGHDVVIVGGFQGVSYKREVTTLGRGGSDTTAVALAAALGADCEIYSDVDGVYSADPRVVPDAARIDLLDYAVMQALSRAGARVLHEQCVAIAARAGIAIYARATADGGRPGSGETIVRRAEPPRPEVVAVAHDEVCVIEIAFRAPPVDLPALTATILSMGLRFPRISARGISALCSTRQRDDLPAVLDALGAALEGGDGGREVVADLHVDEQLALISGVGAGLELRDDLAALAAVALSDAGVPLRGALADAHTLAFLVERRHAEAATRALHGALVGGVDAPQPPRS